MAANDTVVYTPNYRKQTGFFETWILMVKNIVRSRSLIFQLFKRDFLMGYKKSFIGLAWILISPIIGIASWVILNSAGILEPGNTAIPFPVYILLGTSIWGLFMGFYGSAAGTLSAGGGFINQVKYPHEALLIKQTAQNIANFSITFLINFVILLVFGVTPSIGILLLPILAIPLFLIGAALGLLISVISVVASDISNITGICLSFVFYVTPIVYTKDSVESPILEKLIDYNPLTYLIAGTRDFIIYGKMADPEIFVIVSVLSLVLFLISWRLFFVSEYKVIEKII